MSIDPTALAVEGSFAPADDRASQAPSRSLIRQAYHDTLSSVGARIGLAWLFLLLFFAVFAPFLANSHPYAAKINGKWSFPAFTFLTPSDVLLLVAVAVAATLFFWRRFTFLQSIGILSGILLIAAVPVRHWVKPPDVDVLERYRDYQAQGEIQHAIYAPIPYSPQDRLRDQPDARLRPPSRKHWAGTDTNGADVFSMLLHASRIALSIGFLATAISLVIGIIYGAVMGYFVGVTDLIAMRIIEIVDSIPTLFLLIAITAFIEKRNIYVLMAVIGAISWTGYARFIRAEFFTIRKLDYVQAAVAAGLPKRIILFRHMLANALTPILVSSTFGVASAILYESILSFLGIGLVDEASWGVLLQQARAGGAGFVWWIALFPGAAIFLTVFAYNLVGEAIRDALDPKLRKRD
ncbi:MAG TPA: ABC transporter permease [Tepidisphaeraceae bacterium]|jgi:peptide/nickel transport system permease protein|nr:ABC transporter permease [Tepidisphaeraceae bacterium]